MSRAEAAFAGVPATGGTREMILQAALTRFAEHGYHATSLNEIAHDVGIRRPSLLHHFPSKDALYREVIVGGFLDWSALVDGSLESQTQGWDKVERVIRAAFHFFAEHPEFVRLVRHEALDGGPVLTAELGDWLQPMFERAVEFFEREMAAGRLRTYDARHLLLAGYGAALSYFSDAPLTGALLGTDPLADGELEAHRDLILGIFRTALVP